MSLVVSGVWLILDKLQSFKIGYMVMQVSIRHVMVNGYEPFQCYWEASTGNELLVLQYLYYRLRNF